MHATTKSPGLAKPMCFCVDCWPDGFSRDLDLIAATMLSGEEKQCLAILRGVEVTGETFDKIIPPDWVPLGQQPIVVATLLGKGVLRVTTRGSLQVAWAGLICYLPPPRRTPWWRRILERVRRRMR